MEQLSDEILLKQWVGGDRGAFDALYHRYAAKVHATALRLTGRPEEAEDALQEVFLTLARKAAMIRAGGALPTWIYRTTVNKATDLLRRRRPTVGLDEEGAAAAAIIHVASLRKHTQEREVLEREEMFDWIAAQVPRLPARQGAVFVLRGFQGLSHREIGEILECGESTSKSQFCLACRKLREWHVAEEREQDAEGRGGAGQRRGSEGGR